MKKIIICITIFFISIQTVSAARNNSLVVGVEYSITHSTVKKAQMFTKYAKTLGYSGVTDTIPTITSLQNDYKTYRLNGGILFFAGEGAPQKNVLELFEQKWAICSWNTAGRWNVWSRWL